MKEGNTAIYGPEELRSGGNPFPGKNTSRGEELRDKSEALDVRWLNAVQVN